MACFDPTENRAEFALQGGAVVGKAFRKIANVDATIAEGLGLRWFLWGRSRRSI
jgi:hypothetical protein